MRNHFYTYFIVSIKDCGFNLNENIYFSQIENYVQV